MGPKADVEFQNAFSKKLAPLGFNLFYMLLVDLMHEFELGVWKALFIHLLQMLNAMDKSLIHELDHWYANTSRRLILRIKTDNSKFQTGTHFWPGYHQMILKQYF